MWGAVDYLLTFVTGRQGDVFSSVWAVHTFPNIREYVLESYQSGESADETALIVAERVLAATLQSMTPEELAAAHHPPPYHRFPARKTFSAPLPHNVLYPN